MSLHSETQKELKLLIDSCNEFEGKYYLLPLFENLATSDRSAEQLEPIARQLISLIKNINDIKNAELSLKERFEAIKQISINYSALIKETGANGILYKSRQALLNLGGFIIGLVTGIIGAVVGSISLTLSDIKNFRLPTGLFIGAFTGFIVGLVIGNRAPHSLLKEGETRLIRHAVRKLETSFESLFTSINHDYMEEIKDEVLKEYFSGDAEQFNAFLKTKQKYEILGIEAEFLSPKLKGSLGHHSFIKFTINDVVDKPKLIELGIPSNDVTEFSQQESRETTGEQLIRMLSMHKILQEQYEVRLSNILKFYNRYEVGINDCHTYIDKILISVDEPVSQVKRFTSSDTIFGHIIGSLLNFFNPLPAKKENTPSNSDKSHDAQDQHDKPKLGG
ncbi:GlsB/YeaQ/YmgE family stress response membrane protein [Legionella bononiensis]|uniref:Uncharacterized protein n=1 Tax=Legionella bononiensis TaxID=2793102 RepID=A0ABS1WAI6_9GAMM|nr:hypothetical protein [Legionella bononiensis]MBL7480486.1 hypothetical protein [Legionella bononiensis]MBL7526275.1 hypothetical protein [Legionella bononiensis]MBL7563230.1 hypothetical protein [Legionella bononiensis]